MDYQKIARDLTEKLTDNLLEFQKYHPEGPGEQDVVMDTLATELPKLMSGYETALKLLDQTIEDSRIRHDHDWPMDFGPHHCDGCDLQDRIVNFIVNPQ